MPEVCAFAPGAWLAISTRAVADIWMTGRGSNGGTSAHARQARTSASKESSAVARFSTRSPIRHAVDPSRSGAATPG